jgi:hypothetical protein
MNDPITWLHAIWDEAEKAAKRVLALELDGYEWAYRWVRVGCNPGRVIRPTFEPGAPAPRHVLARIEAGRRILDEHPPILAPHGLAGACERCVDTEQGGPDPAAQYPCRTVRLLAYAERHHPGYNYEWWPAS